MFIGAVLTWVGYTGVWFGWLCLTNRVPPGAPNSIHWPSIQDLVSPGKMANLDAYAKVNDTSSGPAGTVYPSNFVGPIPSGSARTGAPVYPAGFVGPIPAGSSRAGT
ncbi:MAG: hypothetical protein ACREMY_00875, partial [bacterium]